VDVLAPRIAELREGQDRLPARKDELQMLLNGQKAQIASEKEVAQCAADFKQSLQDGSLFQRKAFVRSFVNQVLDIGQRGGRYWT
jgi:hypothetical protein